jgi:hypothetical protein
VEETETETLIRELEQVLGPPPSAREGVGGRGGTVPPPEHRFKPGQSGNPGGRPKGVVTNLIRQLLIADEQVFAKAMVLSMFRNACLGNPVAMRMIVERIDGTFGASGELIDVDHTETPTVWPEKKPTPENRRNKGRTGAGK